MEALNDTAQVSSSSWVTAWRMTSIPGDPSADKRTSAYTVTSGAIARDTCKPELCAAPIHLFASDSSIAGHAFVQEKLKMRPDASCETPNRQWASGEQCCQPPRISKSNIANCRNLMLLGDESLEDPDRYLPSASYASQLEN